MKQYDPDQDPAVKDMNLRISLDKGKAEVVETIDGKEVRRPAPLSGPETDPVQMPRIDENTSNNSDSKKEEDNKRIS